MITRREPAKGEDADDRDVQNERIAVEEEVLQKAKTTKADADQVEVKKCVINTSMGEIHIEIYPRECPKTCENFLTHAKNNYYNNCTFHRVIKSFMIQTGDAEFGDGTGGSSIWGHEFEDEIRLPQLSHKEPYMLAMANCGPNTNGSQFYITTVPCPWLDSKHTVFGKVVRGHKTVKDIEATRVEEKTNKPLMDIRLVSIKVLD